MSKNKQSFRKNKNRKINKNNLINGYITNFFLFNLTQKYYKKIKIINKSKYKNKRNK
jgi:hypothetical protein